MLPPETLVRLREAQRRSAHEQQLLSGRDWILIAMCVQLLSALHPLFVWINVLLLDAPSPVHAEPAIALVAALGLAAALGLLSWWAKYAPFRAAVVAVLAFLAAQATVGYFDPGALISGAIVKSIVLVGLLQAARIGHFRRRAL